MVPMPAQISLAMTPTPLHFLPRLSARDEIDLWIKRDDLTGAALSGNKVRKLEFLLADALARGADTVITCGGAQSNHCRATAVAAAQLGLKCRLLLRTADPTNPPAMEANIFLDRLVGAEIVWITPEEYRRRRELLAREAAGRNAYIIPEGGSNALGAWGYVKAMAEMAPALTPDTTLVYAAGSGGTGAGLIVGARLLGLRCRIVGVNVCDDRAYFVNAIGEICEEMLGAASFEREREVEILDGFVGRGYAQSTPDELRLIADVARTEGIILDPVYTGKAFGGMMAQLAKPGKRLVFLHTGGMFGLFPSAVTKGF